MRYALFFLIALVLIVSSCGDDDEKTCTTCSSSQTIVFTVCEESDGNASVNGENTGTSYDVYLEGLREAGASCGE